MYTPIPQWAEDDRPREKFILKGKSALSDAELIAILLGSGTRNESALQLSQRILAHSQNNLNEFGKSTVPQLMKFKGVGQVKAITIAAAFELGRRRRLEEVKERFKISSSRSVFDLMQPLLGELPHEEFWVLFLNNSNRVLHKELLSKGGITGTVVDIRLIFKFALEYKATSLILTHNHPSGKLLASEADRLITQRIQLAGKHLDILVLDHIIITETAYFSFADEGIL
ncbi:DNA repair protein RadC [Flavobacterium sp.]|uniref:RadC family protein n=1 Tax=Flavobacterium sp. TaxID=239 RepID=UPI0026339312|nr:DNA repair protein RadC [Flavobacterium sp.]